MFGALGVRAYRVLYQRGECLLNRRGYANVYAESRAGGMFSFLKRSALDTGEDGPSF
jgi:hypothetical protein